MLSLPASTCFLSFGLGGGFNSGSAVDFETPGSGGEPVSGREAVHPEAATEAAPGLSFSRSCALLTEFWSGVL